MKISTPDNIPLKTEIYSIPLQTEH